MCRLLGQALRWGLERRVEMAQRGSRPALSLGTLQFKRVLLGVVMVGPLPLGWRCQERMSPKRVDSKNHRVLSRSSELAFLVRGLHSFPF